MATGTQLVYDPANYYVWRAPSGFSVHLSLHVIRELAAKIAVSSEAHGILLGRSLATPAATMVDDFVLIPASEDVETARREAEDIRRDFRVIGYFRSQSDGRLRLGASDVKTFDRLFCENGNVGLLIRAPRGGHGEAALFYLQDGQPQPSDFGLGFPFDEMKLAEGHPGWRFSDPFETEEDAAQSILRRTSGFPADAPGEGVRWFRLLPTMALVVIGIVATQTAWNSGRAASNDSAPTAESTSTAVVATYETPLGLKVASQPHQLDIRWNRSASAVAAAVKGTMNISEGGVTEAVPFEGRELREGYVAYTPKTNDVNIRFEVTAADGVATTESIRVVAIP
jgi:hypothetical protein